MSMDDMQFCIGVEFTNRLARFSLAYERIDMSTVDRSNREKGEWNKPC